MAHCRNERNGVFSEYRHNASTEQFPACWHSGAVSETTEGALFLPSAKDEISHLVRGGFSCFGDTSIEKA